MTDIGPAEVGAGGLWYEQGSDKIDTDLLRIASVNIGLSCIIVMKLDLPSITAI